MTVEKLMELLSQQPKDAVILIPKDPPEPWGYAWRHLEKVEHSPVVIDTDPPIHSVFLS